MAISGELLCTTSGFTLFRHLQERHLDLRQVSIESLGRCIMQVGKYKFTEITYLIFCLYITFPPRPRVLRFVVILASTQARAGTVSFNGYPV